MSFGGSNDSEIPGEAWTCTHGHRPVWPGPDLLRRFCGFVTPSVTKPKLLDAVLSTRSLKGGWPTDGSRR